VNDNSGQWTKEEYQKHLAQKRQDEMEELRKNKPDHYDQVIEAERLGKKPKVSKLMWVSIIMFSAIIVRYIRDILNSISGN